MNAMETVERAHLARHPAIKPGDTVKVHVTAILKKLACYSRTQAAVLVKSLETQDGVPS